MLEGDLKEAKEGLRDSSQRQTALHRKYENLSQRTIQLQEDYNETKLQLQETLVCFEGSFRNLINFLLLLPIESTTHKSETH